MAGYLASANGGFLGALGSITNGGLLIAPSSTTVKGGSGISVSTGSFSAAAASGLSSVRRAATALVAPYDLTGPATLTERAVVDPETFAARRAAWVPAARSASTVRRTRAAIPTTEGTTQNFYVAASAIGSSSATYSSLPFTLVKSTTNTNVWLDNSLITASYFATSDYVTLGAIAENAYASDTSHFGSNVYTSSAPGVQRTYNACNSAGGTIPGGGSDIIAPTDNKINIMVLNSNGLGAGVGGYFDSSNYTPQVVLNCQNGATSTRPLYSNEAPMVYVGVNSKNPKYFTLQEDLVRGMAHETQHLLNFVNHYVKGGTSSASTPPKVEETWIDEGFSMLAQDLAVPAYSGTGAATPLSNDVYDALGRAKLAIANPQNYSLTSFTGTTSAGGYNCSGCYGLEFLFERYLYDRFGGDSYLQRMYASGSYGTAELATITGVDVPTLVSDFYVALAVSGTGTSSDSRFKFSGFNPYGSYKDQFGTTTTLSGPVPMGTIGSSATTYSALTGSAVYLSLPPAVSGQNLKVTDASFGVRPAVLQR